MKEVPLCDPYAWEDPVNFLRNTWWKAFTCVRSPCASEVVNQILFIYLFTMTAGCIIAIFLKYMLAIPIALTFGTIYLIPAFFSLSSLLQTESPAVIPPPVMENFQNIHVPSSPVMADVPTHTMPTAQNPFMNVMVDEIQYNPTRPPAKSIDDPEIGQSLDNAFRVQYLSDPTDVFGKTQSQRQFITMPCTTVPNDQGSYADWLYKIPGKTCKEGNRQACLFGTDGGLIPWLNQG